MLFLLLLFKVSVGKKYLLIKQRWWVCDSFMIPMKIICAYSHKYIPFFGDMVYGVINIVLECRSAD